MVAREAGEYSKATKLQSYHFLHPSLETVYGPTAIPEEQ